MAMNTVEKIVLVRLYGKLGTFILDVSTAFPGLGAEAIRALCIAPRRARWLITSEGRGVTYSVFNGSRNVTAEKLH